MAYALRERKRKCNAVSYSSEEESDSDSVISDPDYVRTARTSRNNNAAAAVAISMKRRKIRKNGFAIPGVDCMVPRRGRSKRYSNEAVNVMSSGMNQEDGNKRSKLAAGSSIQGSNTKPKPAERTVLSWLIAKKSVNEKDILCYKKGEAEKRGQPRKEGVFCICCNNLMSLQEFEKHAGSPMKRPYHYIFVERTGESLLRHMINAWKDKKASEPYGFNHVMPKPGAIDGNDDACQVCADGGDLICCEKCPSTFHPSCIGMENIPQGDWLCPYCVCKYCCGGSGEMLTCMQCEKKYHWKCFLAIEGLDLNKTGMAMFCGTTCRQVHGKLQSLVGVKHDLKEGFSWTLIRCMDQFEIDYENEKIECNVKIPLAWELLNECFKTPIDRHTQINILQSVVFNRGSNLSRLNFRGFYTAVLEKNDGIIAAATIRMHGNKLADMPFMAIHRSYRLKGLSRMLFDAVKYVLSCIEVKHLVIPSIQEVADMWQEKFGFSPIDAIMKAKLANFNTLMFPCASRLQKFFADTSDSSAFMDTDENDKY